MQPLLAQLTLSLTAKEDANFANFYAGRNKDIIAAMLATVQGVGDKQIYLYGVQGQGLSHLLQACCYAASQSHISSVYLPMKNMVNLSSEMLDGLEALSVLCIDDIEAIAGRSDWEEAIFHLYNRVNANGGRIIVAAHDSPKALAIQLPDLISRLAWGVVYQLHPLNDDEKLIVLNMCAARRGIYLSEDVGKYILTHCPRQMNTLFSVLDVLDKASLAAQRRLTIPFVKEVLQL